MPMYDRKAWQERWDAACAEREAAGEKIARRSRVGVAFAGVWLLLITAGLVAGVVWLWRVALGG